MTEKYGGLDEPAGPSHKAPNLVRRYVAGRWTDTPNFYLDKHGNPVYIDPREWNLQAVLAGSPDPDTPIFNGVARDYQTSGTEGFASEAVPPSSYIPEQHPLGAAAYNYPEIPLADYVTALLRHLNEKRPTNL